MLTTFEYHTVVRTTFPLILFSLILLNASAESLTVRFADNAEKRLTPVRVELIDSAGKSIVADNALPISRECAFAPLPKWLAQPPPKSLHNPFTGTEQHYVNGIGQYELEPGEYRLRAFKGPEYGVEERTINVSDKRIHLLIEVSRWRSLSSDRWVSTDAHLHLTRSARDMNENLSLWMAAEGIEIANLLQMGSLTQFAVAPQYAFGDEGAHDGTGALLVAGQEHPRTHMLGHAVSLGALAPVDEREKYIQYDTTFRHVRKAGGISGFAHWGAGPARDGLALNAPLGNVEMLEILSFGFLFLDAWYELLDLGYAIAAVAGTDFPCLPGIPGRERTYIAIDGSANRATMVDALRQGRTFVSNGPMLDLEINGQGIGSKLRLAAVDRIRIEGHVEYNPQQDELKSLQLVHNGEVVRSWPIHESGSFTFKEQIALAGPGWVALRVIGHKLQETKPPPRAFPAWVETAFSNWMSGGGGHEVDAFLDQRKWRGSYAHTSPIFIDLEMGQSGRRKGDAAEMLVRLQRLEAMLLGQEFDEVLIWDWMPYSDGVDAEHLKKNTPGLLAQIQTAREELAKRTVLE